MVKLFQLTEFNLLTNVLSTKSTSRMSLNNVNRQKIRQQAAAVGIFSLAELARKAGCSRQSLYMWIERPSRFSQVNARVNRLLK